MKISHCVEWAICDAIEEARYGKLNKEWFLLLCSHLWDAEVEGKDLDIASLTLPEKEAQ